MTFSEALIAVLWASSAPSIPNMTCFTSPFWHHCLCSGTLNTHKYGLGGKKEEGDEGWEEVVPAHSQYHEDQEGQREQDDD